MKNEQHVKCYICQVGYDGHIKRGGKVLKAPQGAIRNVARKRERGGQHTRAKIHDCMRARGGRGAEKRAQMRGERDDKGGRQQAQRERQHEGHGYDSGRVCGRVRVGVQRGSDERGGGDREEVEHGEGDGENYAGKAYAGKRGDADSADEGRVNER